MRPEDLYALPSIHSRPWHDAARTMGAILGHGLDDASPAIDLRAAEAAGADDIRIETKLDRYVSSDASVTYEVALFRGAPFAFVVTAGDETAAYTTDAALDALAREHVETFRARPVPDVTDPSLHMDILDGAYDHRILPIAGRLRLVPRNHMSPEGRPILDDEAYHAAFDRILRPAYDLRAFEDPEWKEGIRGERMRRLAAGTFLAALTEGVRGTTSFGPLPAAAGPRPLGIGWAGAIATDGIHTYAIGLRAYDISGYFAWANSVTVWVIGPADLHDELAVRPEAA